MVTLFRSQFMLVRGQATDFQYEDAESSSPKTRHLINLDIVLQINGGLRNISLDYLVYKFPGTTDITFCDWQRWTDFYSLMSELGYPMHKGDIHEVVLGGSAVMKEWVERLYPNEKYIEDFDGVGTKAIADEKLVKLI